jgi:hypothetical protein
VFLGKQSQTLFQVLFKVKQRPIDISNFHLNSYAKVKNFIQTKLKPLKSNNGNDLASNGNDQSFVENIKEIFEIIDILADIFQYMFCYFFFDDHRDYGQY